MLLVRHPEVRYGSLAIDERARLYSVYYRKFLTRGPNPKYLHSTLFCPLPKHVRFYIDRNNTLLIKSPRAYWDDRLYTEAVNAVSTPAYLICKFLDMQRVTKPILNSLVCRIIASRTDASSCRTAPT